MLLADGAAKRIEDVVTGDQVLATNEITGETAARDVVGTIVGDGTKNLVEVSVEGGGVVTATDNHPFWLPEQKKWTFARELKTGSVLLASAGAALKVSAAYEWTTQGRVHNLTVDSDRTYHVLFGATPVLVHNCGEATLGVQADGGEIRGSDFAAECELRSGYVYRSGNKESVISPDEMMEIFEQQGHPMNGGCAEMRCLSKVYSRKGEVGIRGGTMSTVHVSDTPKGDHGAPVSPCKACRRVMDSLRVNC
ncbi:polymorphic toxin-type HINT domain-containing protein [Lentzea sp. NPDC060358]|uniref:polymorphic toxin-type HINT domain-containing protein n=1 Tax=Lentzea sp. NPDC060358 TaxID=3347103 RepID=UPI00365BF4F2